MLTTTAHHLGRIACYRGHILFEEALIQTLGIPAAKKVPVWQKMCQAKNPFLV
jgi:hypothetical protein